MVQRSPREVGSVWSKYKWERRMPSRLDLALELPNRSVVDCLSRWGCVYVPEGEGSAPNMMKRRRASCP